jgi:hypothetical protein
MYNKKNNGIIIANLNYVLQLWAHLSIKEKLKMQKPFEMKAKT